MHRPLLPAAATGVLLIVYLGAVLILNGGDPLAFATLGTRFSTGDPHGTSGYDGQFSYYIARDPAGAPAHLDVPAYRFQRLLYPMLARALAGGRAERIAWTLPFIGLAAHVAGTWAVAGLISASGLSSWYALAYGLWAGFVYAVRLDLPEPLAYGLAAGALLAYRRGRPGWSAGLFGLAALAKETALLFVAGQAAYLAVRRQWRDLGWLALALLPFVALQVVLWQWLGSPGVASGGDMATPFEWIPYMGVWRIGAASLPLLGLYLAVLGPSVLLPSLWGIGASLRRLARREWHPAYFALAVNAGIFPFVPFSTYREPLGILRFACGLVLAVVLFAAQTGSKRVLNYSLFSIGLLAMLFWVT